MKTGEYTRKLTAILSADVKGYSRLMEDDEIATIATLKRCRSVIGAAVERFRGRVVDSPGDNILAEFASVMDAVRCALDIQRLLAEENRQLARHRRMLFRIGINIGDVVQEGERIYGDGVNIAARMESLSDAGGICISGTVHEHIRNKLPLRDEFIGKHTVKNISEPIRVYRIFPADAPGKPGAIKKVPAAALSLHRRRPLITAMLLLVIAGCCAALVAVLGPGAKETPPAASPPETTLSGTPVFHSFEKPEQDSDIWVPAYDRSDIRLKIVRQHALFGEHALRLILPAMDYPGITSGRLPKDWRPFSTFSLALFVDTLPDTRLLLGIRIDDARTDSYYTRFNFKKPLRKGWNRIEIPVDPIGNAIDITSVEAVYIFLDEPTNATTLWLDGVSLK